MTTITKEQQIDFLNSIKLTASVDSINQIVDSIIERISTLENENIKLNKIIKNSHVWSVEDILHQANEDGFELTEDEAQEVLWGVINDADASIGVNWDVISFAIEEFAEEKGYIRNEDNEDDDDNDEDDE